VIGFDTHLLQVSRVVREEKQQCWQSCAVYYRHCRLTKFQVMQFQACEVVEKSKKIDATTFLKRALNFSSWGMRAY